VEAVSALTDGARELGVDLSAAQLAQLDQLGAAVREANQRVNLTRIIEPGDIETRHFLDSLTAALPLLDKLAKAGPLRLVDIGSGGGMPGLPLKIAFPNLRVTLIEATKKKADFLRQVVEQLRLQDVEIVADRAETAAHDFSHRDTYDWATARALGPLPVVVELAAPFLAPGGLLVAQRGGNLHAQLAEAAPAFKALKLWARVPIPLHLAGLDGQRGLIVGEKYAPTPAAYPRRPGIARKRPLA
jgi:16S rRNA (guanine527-N7)-methyltransferase